MSTLDRTKRNRRCNIYIYIHIYTFHTLFPFLFAVLDQSPTARSTGYQRTRPQGATRTASGFRASALSPQAVRKTDRMGWRVPFSFCVLTNLWGTYAGQLMHTKTSIRPLKITDRTTTKLPKLLAPLGYKPRFGYHIAHTGCKEDLSKIWRNDRTQDFHAALQRFRS